MSDIVERLRGVDHESVEDCFLLSPLFAHAADEITRLRTELADARNKALEEAAMRIEKIISDMHALEKFNRSYALRIAALALADIRAMKAKQ
ncbi:hypothetical protein [Agrobacterium vitis]|uniref:hypothetical protein n=1 Tax=Agrobacterium vitis TaxID=373 RepID=UPI0008731C79|nr:hypothetical protein [Agrobacterium vitis]MCM2453372.1 hypothetical protein [Agrobacterium vitis]MCM2470947.1 hypothetical protein [Agrobacterium vitis]MUO70061.1 hypothetical protein [Agrobacterium vitis]